MIVEGKVVKGNRIGRTIGFPTANLQVKNASDLPAGVFACRVFVPNRERGLKAFFRRLFGKSSSVSGKPSPRVSHTSSGPLTGMLNIGTRPTLGSATPSRTVEVHILDFNGNLYGRRPRVEILQKIRDEQKFSSLSTLQAQLEKDRRTIRDLMR